MGNIVTEKFIKWQKRENNTEQTKTNAPFQNMVRLVAKDVHPGTYKFHWYCEVKNEAPNDAVIVVRAKVKTNIVGFHEFEIPNEDFQSFAGWDFVQLGERETPEVLLEWRRPSGTADVVARNARVSIEFMESVPGPRGQIGGDQGQGAQAATARGRP